MKLRTAVILGGGPSLTQELIGVVQARRMAKDGVDYVIATNNAYGDPIRNNGNLLGYEPRNWVDALWFCDDRWFRQHQKWLSNYKGSLYHCCFAKAGVDGVKFVRRKPYGIEHERPYIAWNGNSGGSAINLAYHLGFRKVILVGFDMRVVNGKHNWHDDHKVKLPSNYTDNYKQYLRTFPYIATDANRLGLEIVNATIGSAIEVFPILPFDDAVKVLSI